MLNIPELYKHYIDDGPNLLISALNLLNLLGVCLFLI